MAEGTHHRLGLTVAEDLGQAMPKAHTQALVGEEGTRRLLLAELRVL